MYLKWNKRTVRSGMPFVGVLPYSQVLSNLFYFWNSIYVNVGNVI